MSDQLKSAVQDSVTTDGLAIGALLRGWVKVYATQYRHPVVDVVVRVYASGGYVVSYPSDHVEEGTAHIRLPDDSKFGTVVDVARALAMLLEARA